MLLLHDMFCSSLLSSPFVNHFAFSVKGGAFSVGSELRSVYLRGCSSESRPPLKLFFSIVSLYLSTSSAGLIDNLPKVLLDSSPKLELLDVGGRGGAKITLSNLKMVQAAQPYVKLGRKVWGVEPVENRRQAQARDLFDTRMELECASSTLIQKRYKKYLQGPFTTQYLIVWTKRLKRKADITKYATNLQWYVPPPSLSLPLSLSRAR